MRKCPLLPPQLEMAHESLFECVDFILLLSSASIERDQPQCTKND
jgi:hypothetical protein